MKILVTGASGFIGRYVCEELWSRGHSVVAFDHTISNSPDAWSHLAWPPQSKLSLYVGDVRDYTAVAEAVATSDGVIHLAGVLGTQETIKEPRPSVETNIFGALNIFKAASHYGKRVVNIAVGNYWMDNSYSITKSTAERFASMYAKEFAARITTVRGLNVYGPRQKVGPVRKIVPNFIVPLLKNEKIRIYGTGEQVMDMIYVTDIARVLVAALDAPEDLRADRDVIEAGNGKMTTVLDIARSAVRCIHGDVDLKECVEFVPMRPGEEEDAVVVATHTEKLNMLPGIEFGKFTPLEMGLSMTAAWYAAHPEVWG